MYPYHDFHFQQLLLEERRERARRHRNLQRLPAALRRTGDDGQAPAAMPEPRRRRGRRWTRHTRPRPAT